MKLAQKILKSNITTVSESTNDGRDIEPGFYLVQSDFSIGFGAWSIRFKKDQLLEYTKGNMMLMWDVLKKQMRKRSPPISGVEKLTLSAYDHPYEQKAQVQKFERNTKKISKKEFEKIKEEAPSEIVGTVKEVMSKLKTMNPKDKVKLTIVG